VNITANLTILKWLIVLCVTIALAPKVKARLALSRAKHPSVAGHARMARRLAGLLPYYEFDASRFFCVDGAPAAVSAQRSIGFTRLARRYADRHAQTLALTAIAANGVSDLQFTDAYRVPFQFRRYLRQHIKTGAFLKSSSGVLLTDLDGNTMHDVSGSYGVNLFGYDFFKECITEGVQRAAELGPVLGAYHPVLADNVRSLQEISGLDEVSFHMSGTEAVMQAVRLARYHTRRTHLMRFCGAYHGWWGDVQPGVGNPVPAHETYTLKDMHADTLTVLQTRRDIACVLVNPLQALHPNSAAPSDSALIDSSRRADYDPTAYKTCIFRVSLRARWCPGVFRRSGRYGHLWQGTRWRASDRRALRAQGSHASLP
jgi:glutamate-1-semialdehyde 2,1-aminomutase